MIKKPKSSIVSTDSECDSDTVTSWISNGTNNNWHYDIMLPTYTCNWIIIIDKNLKEEDTQIASKCSVVLDDESDLDNDNKLYQGASIDICINDIIHMNQPYALF